MADKSQILSQRAQISLIDLKSSAGGYADDHYDFLTSLFEILQLTTHEASDLQADFMSFVDSVQYLAIITRDRYKTYGKLQSSLQGCSSDPPAERHEGNDAIGMLYLTSPSEMRNSALGMNDLNIGVIVHSQFRRKGYAAQAIKLALDHAFRVIRCHRVQAIIINPFIHAMYPSYRLFTSIGFEQEGIRRRSYFNVFDNEYQDIAYLAVLDTEWLTKGGAIARGSPWNELLYRHDKERQMILLWEERSGAFDDTETLRHFPLEAGSECGESVAGGESSAEPSRATSRASTPGLYVSSQPVHEGLYPECIGSGPSEGRAESPLSDSSSWDLVEGGYSSLDEMGSDLEVL